MDGRRILLAYPRRESLLHTPTDLPTYPPPSLCLTVLFSWFSCQRVMPTSFFVLLRFFLRVDGVIIRINDTRLYHEASSTAGPRNTDASSCGCATKQKDLYTFLHHRTERSLHGSTVLNRKIASWFCSTKHEYLFTVL